MLLWHKNGHRGTAPKVNYQDGRRRTPQSPLYSAKIWLYCSLSCNRCWIYRWC